MQRFQKALLLVLTLLMLVVSIHFTPVRTAQAAYTCGATTRWNVVLERDMRDIGDVYVWNTSDSRLNVRPVLQYGWHMSETWLDVATYFGGLPRNADGTLQYSSFDYHRTHSPARTDYVYNLPWRSSWLIGTELHIALRLNMVKLDSSGRVIDRAIGWGYQKAVGPALYFKHTIHTCKDLSQYDGCPNYWWQSSTHHDSWVNHRPTDSFNRTFGRTAFNPDKTLLQVLALTDNGLGRAARHSVAALLNADHPNINYAYSVSEVMSIWYKSYDTRNYASAANTFIEANNTGCPLN